MFQPVSTITPARIPYVSPCFQSARGLAHEVVVGMKALRMKVAILRWQNAAATPLFFLDGPWLPNAAGCPKAPSPADDRHQSRFAGAIHDASRDPDISG
jgi:hypothetical protein